MARDISSRALECIKSGPQIATKVTVTVPGGDPVELVTSPGWEAQEVGPVAGTRGTISSIQFLPTDGVDDLYGLVAWPGAVFDAFIGINLGTTVEYLQVFHGYAVDRTTRRNSLGVASSLSDPWFYYDKIKLSAAFKTTTATRAEQIGSLFTMLDLSVSVVIADDADGGNVVQPAVYTDTRSQPATDLAQDGKLQAGFDGDGDLVIKTQPDVTGVLEPVWTFKSGNADRFHDFGLLATDYPTIVAGTLERTGSIVEALYNSVTVVPNGDWQTWTAQTVSLADADDPRHADLIGLRRLKVTSNTIDNACDALLLAKQILGALLRGSDERVRVVIAINPAVEADDICYIAAGPTNDDLGWGGTYIITSVTHSPSAGTTSIEAMSAASYAMEQAA